MSACVLIRRDLGVTERTGPSNPCCAVVAGGVVGGGVVGGGGQVVRSGHTTPAVDTSDAELFVSHLMQRWYEL